MEYNRKTIQHDEEYLRLVSDSIDFTKDNVLEYINKVKDYCKNNKVYAISPVQIGIPKRIIYIKNTKEGMSNNGNSKYDEGIVYINPVIKRVYGITKFFECCESCIYKKDDKVIYYGAFVDRPYEIEIEYYDINGNLKQKEIRGFEATIFSHEYDHLNGVLHIDKADKIYEVTLDEAEEIRKKNPYKVESKLSDVLNDVNDSKYDLGGINKITKQLLFNDGKFENESMYGSGYKLYIIKSIEDYTRDKSNNKNISCDKKNNIYSFHINDKYKLNFELISENLDNISKSKSEELESYDRQERCHIRSIDIAINIKDASVLTGYIKLESRYILHSVVRTIGIYTKKVKIIDWTRNLIMEEKDYFDLFDFTVFEEVKSNELKEDLKKFVDYGFIYLSNKVYLTFRNELVNNLEKNKFLLSLRKK